MERINDLIRLFRTLYLISTESEKHEIVLDEETVKSILDDLKQIAVPN